MRIFKVIACGLAFAWMAPALAIGAEGDLIPRPTSPATVIPDSSWSAPITESDGTRFSCPAGKILVGRDHQGDENGETKYLCGTVQQDGQPVTVSNKTWSSEYSENSHTYICPLNRIMAGRYHVDDENGDTEYECAEAKDAAGDTMSMFPVGTWTLKTESSHQFTCPENTVLIGRRHEGDENGDTNYTCGYLIAATTPDTLGSLVFRHWETKQPCSLGVPDDPGGATWSYLFRADKAPCADNIAESIELENLRSAVRIFLTDDELCQKEGNFWIELRTTRQPTTVATINIPEIIAFNKGDIIRPGLMLVDYFHDGSAETVKALSCVQIANSARPQ